MHGKSEDPSTLTCPNQKTSASATEPAGRAPSGGQATSPQPPLDPRVHPCGHHAATVHSLSGTWEQSSAPRLPMLPPPPDQPALAPQSGCGLNVHLGVGDTALTPPGMKSIRRHPNMQGRGKNEVGVATGGTSPNKEDGPTPDQAQAHLRNDTHSRRLLHEVQTHQGQTARHRGP